MAAANRRWWIPPVRQSWQLNTDQVRIRGSGWVRTLDAIVARAAEGLGVTGKVAAEFYKLLVTARLRRRQLLR